MKVVWQIDKFDIESVQEFYTLHRDNPFVMYRYRHNIEKTDIELSKPNLPETTLTP